MSNPLLSVAVIAYNHEKYIRQALDSVLMQKTDFPFEIVIGEDYSTDGTAEIISSVISNSSLDIKVITSDSNVGALSNVFRTYDACHGKYIAILEGDDYWTDSHKLQKQVDFLEKNNDFTICFHKVKILSNGKIKKDTTVKIPSSISTIQDLGKRNYIHTPSCVFRKNNDVIKKLWEYKELKVGDYLLHLYNAKNGRIKYFDKNMAVYRVHKDSNWSKQDSEYIVENFNNLLQSLIQSGDFNEIEPFLVNQMLNLQWSLFIQNINEEEAQNNLNALIDEDAGFVLNKIRGIVDSKNKSLGEKILKKAYIHLFRNIK